MSRNEMRPGNGVRTQLNLLTNVGNGLDRSGSTTYSFQKDCGESEQSISICNIAECSQARARWDLSKITASCFGAMHCPQLYRGMVKTIPYIDAGVSTVRALRPGVWTGVQVRPLSLARTSPASALRCDCPRQSPSFRIASLPPKGEPWNAPGNHCHLESLRYSQGESLWGAYTATWYVIGGGKVCRGDDYFFTS